MLVHGVYDSYGHPGHPTGSARRMGLIAGGAGLLRLDDGGLPVEHADRAAQPKEVVLQGRLVNATQNSDTSARSNTSPDRQFRW